MARNLTTKQVIKEIAARPVFLDGLEQDDPSMGGTGYRRPIKDELMIGIGFSEEGSENRQNLKLIFADVLGEDWNNALMGLNESGNFVYREKKNLESNSLPDLTNNDITPGVTNKVQTEKADNGYVGFKGTCLYGKKDEVNMKKFCQNVLDLFTKNFKSAVRNGRISFLMNPEQNINCKTTYSIQVLADKITKYEKVKEPTKERSILTINWQSRENENQEAIVSLEEVLKLSIDHCKTEVLEESLAKKTMNLFNKGFEVFLEHLDGPLNQMKTESLPVTDDVKLEPASATGTM